MIASRRNGTTASESVVVRTETRTPELKSKNLPVAWGDRKVRLRLRLAREIETVVHDVAHDADNLPGLAEAQDHLPADCRRPVTEELAGQRVVGDEYAWTVGPVLGRECATGAQAEPQGIQVAEAHDLQRSTRHLVRVARYGHAGRAEQVADGRVAPEGHVAGEAYQPVAKVDRSEST